MQKDMVGEEQKEAVEKQEEMEKDVGQEAEEGVMMQYCQ